MKNTFKSRLLKFESVLGVWSILPDANILEMIGLAGFDFVIIDFEHGNHDISSLSNSVRACENTGCSPLVRTPGLDYNLSQIVLDIGAQGIIFPQIKSSAEARLAINYMNYIPDGSRGFNPFTRAGIYGHSSLGSFSSSQKNNYGVSSVIIENHESYKELDAILEIPNLDMIYLGVYDMSVALECKGDISNKLVQNFIDTTVSKIRKAGKVAALMVKDQVQIKKYQDMGASCFVYTVDSFIIQNAFIDCVKQFKL